MKDRIECLDYFRGLMAVCVMLFHYTLWSGVGVAHDSFINKLGIYAVSAFYVLSGVSMSLSYILGRNSVNFKDFYIRRLFRIVPVFWLALILTVILKYVNYLTGGVVDFNVDVYSFFINFFLIFSFIEPNNYIPIGAWSIGNEVVFYVIFPFLVFSFLKNRYFLCAWFVFSLLCFYYFSFIVFYDGFSLKDSWASYVDPFNHFFCFVVGVTVPILWRRAPLVDILGKFLYYMVLLLICGFIAMAPTSGNDYNYLGGGYRFFYLSMIVLAVVVVYKYGFTVSNIVGRLLKVLGDCCYSVYLLHPIVFFPVSFVLGFFNLSNAFMIAVSFFLTLLVSRFSYRFVEVPCISLGKRYSKYIAGK